MKEMRTDSSMVHKSKRDLVQKMQTEASLNLVLQDFMSALDKHQLMAVPHQITHSIEGEVLYFEVLYREAEFDGRYHAWLVKYTHDETFSHQYDAIDISELKDKLRFGSEHSSRRRMLLRSSFMKNNVAG